MAGAHFRIVPLPREAGGSVEGALGPGGQWQMVEFGTGAVGGDGLHDLATGAIGRGAGGHEDPRRRRAAVHQDRQEQMLGADVVVTELASFLLGGRDDPPGTVAEPFVHPAIIRGGGGRPGDGGPGPKGHSGGSAASPWRASLGTYIGVVPGPWGVRCRAQNAEQTRKGRIGAMGNRGAGDSFTHLHLHTEFSMLDGAARVKDVIAAAVADGQPAIGITDHGNMYGVLDFYKEAKDHGLVPVIGTEAYMAGESRRDRPVRRGRMDDSGGEGDEGDKLYYHLTLLAETTTGYRNLLKLSSAAFLEGYWYKPR